MRRLLLLAALALLELLPCALAAQNILPPINAPVFRAFDANGVPLAGGKLFTYAAGTSTPLATYADAAGAAPNANPVVLDSTGTAKIFLGPAAYKFMLQNANGVQQWTVDNINGAPPVAGATSVFGRTGAVVAVTGDYTCAQVTGAVCSTPTIYYQTIGADGTSASTQRDRLNLVSGTNVTVTCADNATTDSTDCTFNGTGSATPRTCNANGCYRIEGDGTIEQWGVATGCGGSSACNVSVTFPTPFTVSTDLSITVTEQGGGANNYIATVGAYDVSTFSVQYAAAVFVGGTGNQLPGSQTAFWHAVGH